MKKTLSEWHEGYHDIAEYQKTFYIMDMTMKNIHAYNYYITSFNPDKITLEEDSNENPYVVYQELAPMDPEESFKLVQQNKYNLAFLQVGLYSETLPYLKPEFLKENFNQFVIFLPEDDVPYFKSMLTQNGHFYYSEYKMAKNDQTVKKLNQSLEEDNARGKQGRALTKSTAAGRAVVEQMNNLPSHGDDNMSNIAAFVQYFVLPFIVVTLSLLIPLLSWMLALS